MKFIITAAGLALLMTTGCARDHEPEPGRTDSGLLNIHVVNYPLQYMAERIGGKQVAVTFPAPADEDPATWKPSADQVSAYQQADLILLNGAGYAKWIDKVSLPASRMVNTGGSGQDHLIALNEDTTHTHGPTGQHAHSGFAFTTWLDAGTTATSLFTRTDVDFVESCLLLQEEGAPELWPDGQYSFESMV